ncbi:hypothetical protein N665_0077s0026 [Sinapis alba]|nr:hypothetical protein N665_0077s0026 [Sinapis alba]
MKSLTPAAQALTMSTMLLVLASNSPMVSEKKIVSPSLSSCLRIILLSGLLEIHLVSRVNIVGFRADLIHLIGSLASIGFSPSLPNLFIRIFQRRFRLLEALSNCDFKDSSENYYLRIVLFEKVSFFVTLISHALLFYCCLFYYQVYLRL